MNMANTDVGAWRHSEIQSQTLIGEGRNSSDDGLDFPPTAHPFRELVTFSIFLSGLVALIVWGGSKLIGCL
jgi:hypothetical protein